MNISATGPGRRGTLDEGVGRLTLKSTKPHEARSMKVLHDEIRDGNYSYWMPIMWATRHGLMSRKTETNLSLLVEQIQEEWEAYLNGKDEL